MSMNESVTEFLRIFLPSFFPHLLLCKSWEGSGGTDSSTSVSSPSCPVFPLSLNVVNECCTERFRPLANLLTKPSVFYYFANCIL